MTTTARGSHLRDPRQPPSDQVRSVSRALRILELVGESPRGLSVKQIARRCGLNVATVYHLVRTLTYESYLLRRDDATYTIGPAIADRFRQLVTAYRGPHTTAVILRDAAEATGYTHYLAQLIHGRPTVTATAYGPRSPWLDDLIPGFDDAAHAIATGKALLASLTPHQRAHYLNNHGMPRYTSRTLTSFDTLESDLAAGQRRGIHLDINQYRVGIVGAAILAINHRHLDHRVALGCLLPATAGPILSTTSVKAWLTSYARRIPSTETAKPMPLHPFHSTADEATLTTEASPITDRWRPDGITPECEDAV
jgi:DNA-binding IclR family transcriptional regulator